MLTGIGLGLLIGVTLTMAGVYRGMVDDARALLNNSGADLWVVQQDTQGPLRRNRRACATTPCAVCSGCPAWRAPPT